MQWTILGCGASFGVPVIGCTCAVCISENPYNHRSRTAAWACNSTTSLLIDAGPDLRTQALRHTITTVDAVLLTHHHQDHVGGIDDLRPFSINREQPLPIYGPAPTLERIKEQYSYAFSTEPSASSRPKLTLHVIDREPLAIGNVTVQPIPIWHGAWDIRGFRIGNVAYLTDVSAIPEASFQYLQQLDLLILSALRHTPHPLHLTIDAALALIERIKPQHARLTHLAHDLDYDQMNAELPAHVKLAHDGFTFEAMSLI